MELLKFCRSHCQCDFLRLHWDLHGRLQYGLVPWCKIFCDDKMVYSCVLKLICWAPSQYPKRRLIVRSREVSKPRDWYFKLSYRFVIWQAHRQQCCRSACQISERSDNSKYKSRCFETLRDLTIRRLIWYWDGALIPRNVIECECDSGTAVQFCLGSLYVGSWWYHDMETLSSLLALCEGNPPALTAVHQRPVMQNLEFACY